MNTTLIRNLTTAAALGLLALMGCDDSSEPASDGSASTSTPDSGSATPDSGSATSLADAGTLIDSGASNGMDSGTTTGASDSGAAGGETDSGMTSSASDSGMGSTDGGPFGAPPGCASGRTWTPSMGNNERMQPGANCLTCHTGRNRLAVGGTVYTFGHETTLCEAESSVQGAVVRLTDSNNRTVMLQVNSVGNFYSAEQLTPPFTNVRVEYMGRVNAMNSTAPTGACNSCHTQDGATGAPGRIVVP